MARPGVVGAKAVKRRLRKIVRNVNHAVQREMDDIADEMLTASRDLAPQDTGEMIRTSKTDSRDAKRRGRFSRRIKYTEEYAVLQHDYAYQPGPVTAAKLGNFWGVGRGFLLRPFRAMKPKIPDRVGRAVARAIRQSVR